MGTVRVRCDFQEDLRIHLLAKLTALGSSPPSRQDVETICTAYFNVFVRLIPPRPRRVLRSHELCRSGLVPSVASAVNAIERAAVAGDDLRPRMSKRVVDGEFNDACFNDWGIHHLHLGANLGVDGWIERTGDLLYIIVTDDTLHMIDVRPHGPSAWANEELLQIVHDNWPDVIESARARGVVPGSLQPATLAPLDREKLRRRLNFGWQAVDGTIYVPTGGGMMCGGLSVNVRRLVDQARTQVGQLEAFARANAIAIQDKIRAVGPELSELHLQLQLGEPPHLLERQSGVVVSLPVV